MIFFVGTEMGDTSLHKAVSSNCNQNEIITPGLQNVNIFHQNLCGISNKKNELDVYLQSLDFRVD